MQIVPVIDIRNGVAVRAIAGQRHAYRPLVSNLTDSVEPAEVLRVLAGEFGFSCCYVADLDAIEKAQPNRCVLAEMSRTGMRLIVDAGCRNREDALQLSELDGIELVVSSESWRCLQELPELLQSLSDRPILFSLDLKNGQLQAEDPFAQSMTPGELAHFAVQCGLKTMIVLDIAAVGIGSGIRVLPLCRQLRKQFPELALISGGGVHSPECLKSARQSGLDGLLVGSALHDGRLRPDANLMNGRFVVDCGQNSG